MCSKHITYRRLAFIMQLTTELKIYLNLEVLPFNERDN